MISLPRPGRPLILAAALLAAASPLAGQGLGIDVAYYSATPQSYLVISAGSARRLSSTLSLTISGSWYTPLETSGGSLLGIGGDLSLWRGGNPGLYVVGGLSGGFGFNGATMLWGSYSAGLGYDFRLFKAVGLGVEARWRGLTQDGDEGVQVGVRIGGGMRRSSGGGSAPAPAPTNATPPASGTAPAPAGVPPSAAATAVVATALGAMGTPYAWGGSSADGFDCSGLIQYAYAQHGVPLPRTSAQQATAGAAVDRDLGALAPGDILTFAASPGGTQVNHVGLYVGGGEFIHSATGGVQQSRLSADDPYGKWWFARWVGARRIVPG